MIKFKFKNKIYKLKINNLMNIDYNIYNNKKKNKKLLNK